MDKLCAACGEIIDFGKGEHFCIPDTQSKQTGSGEAREYFGVTENMRNPQGKIVIGVTIYRGNQSRDGLKRENLFGLFFDDDCAREFIFGYDSLKALWTDVLRELETALSVQMNEKNFCPPGVVELIDKIKTYL